MFAAGDAVSGTSFVIDAIADGHKCAASIHQYLRGEEVKPRAKSELPVVHMDAAEIQDRVSSGEIKPKPRISMPELPVEARRGNFDEVESAFSRKKKPAQRPIAASPAESARSA